MTPQRLELQEHLEYGALLACAATRSRGRRSDVDEDTAAATARKKRRRNVLNNDPKSQNTEGHRERKIVAGGFGGTPPVLSRPGVRRAPATASIGKSTTISLCPDPSRRKGPVESESCCHTVHRTIRHEVQDQKGNNCGLSSMGSSARRLGQVGWSARRLRQEPFDGISARMSCHWRARCELRSECGVNPPGVELSAAQQGHRPPCRRKHRWKACCATSTPAQPRKTQRFCQVLLSTSIMSFVMCGSAPEAQVESPPLSSALSGSLALDVASQLQVWSKVKIQIRA